MSIHTFTEFYDAVVHGLQLGFVLSFYLGGTAYLVYLWLRKSP